MSERPARGPYRVRRGENEAEPWWPDVSRTNVVERVLALPPADVEPIDERDWAGFVVVVDCGVVELRASRNRLRLGEGAILVLAGLGVREVHNPGPGPTVLVGYARRRDRRDLADPPASMPSDGAVGLT